MSVRWGQVVSFSLVWLAYCATYFLRKPLGVIKSDLGTDLGLSKTELGWCDLALALPYALVQIVLPSLASRHGPRQVLSLCLASGGLATWLTYSGPISSSLPGICLGLALTGGLLAPAWPACSASVSAWFPDNKLNSIFGLLNTSAYAGGLGGTALTAALLEYSGWRSVGPPPAIIAIITGILVFTLLSSPGEKGVTVPGKTVHTEEVKVVEKTNDSLLDISRIPCVRQVAASMFTLKFVRYSMYMWLPLYLLEQLGYSKLQAGMFSTVYDIGGIVGSMLQGLLLDRFCPDQPLMGVTLTMALGTLVTTLFVLTASWGLVFNLSLLLVAGAANCGPDAMLAGSISMRLGEEAGKGKGATVASFINGMGLIGSIIEGPLIGFLLTLAGWDVVLLSLVGLSAVGTLLLFQAYNMSGTVRIVKLPS